MSLVRALDLVAAVRVIYFAHRPEEAMFRQLSRSSVAALLAGILAAFPLMAQQPATTGTTTAASTAKPPTPPGDPWPRRIVSGTYTFLIYQPQLDSWKNGQLEAHAAVSAQAKGAKDPTFGVIWFQARTDVDKVNRLVYLEDLNDHADELSLGRRPGCRVDRGAAGEGAGQEVEGDLARPPRGAARHRRGEDGGRGAAARQHPAADHRFPGAGRARPRGRPAGFSPTVRNGSAARDQHEHDHPQGGLG